MQAASKIKDLIEQLQQFPQDTYVIGTYQGVMSSIYVYMHRDGTLLLDIDHCRYKENFQNEPKPIQRSHDLDEKNIV